MNLLLPVSARLYSLLQRFLLPGMSRDYGAEAQAVFRDLGRDAKDAGPGKFSAFLWREFTSLFRAASQDRAEARKAGSGKTGKGFDPRSGKGSRSVGPGGWRVLLDTLRQDVRYAVRNLSRTPGFVVVSVFSLTFGIAVSTALFSVANAVLLRPLPHASEPEELVRVFSGSRRFSRGPLSFPDYLDLKTMAETLDGIAVVSGRRFSVGFTPSTTRQVSGIEVSEDYFDVLGIRMIRGRGFLPEDIDSGGRVAVIGFNLWQREFDGDPGVMGASLLVDGHSHTIVGVGPEGMVGVGGPVLLELVVPVIEHRDNRGRQAYTGVARLQDGIGPLQAQAELTTLAQHLADEHPEYWTRDGNDPRDLVVRTFREAMLPENGAPFLAVLGFLAVVGLILLISCSNVANLLLTRAYRRREEVAIRSAVGAGRRRITSQLLTENLILFGLSGGLGLLLTHWIASLAGSGWAILPPPGAEFSVDGRVAAFTIGLSLLTGLTFGLFPALQASKADLVSAMKGRTRPLSFRRFGMRNLLVGVQVGGSLVLVLITLLLVRSLTSASSMDLGFQPENVAVLSLDLSHGDYGEEDGKQFVTGLRDRLETLPDVESTALATWVPLQGGSTVIGGLEPEGYVPAPNEYVNAGMSIVSPGYLDLLGIRLLQGRDLLPRDRADAEKVVLVSQAFVRHFWPGESGVGKYINRGERDPFLVVGVVADIPFKTINEEPEPHLWIPFGQWYQSDVILHIRTTGDPRPLLPTFRLQVADLDPDLPVVRVDLMENVTDNATDPHRILASALGIAGLFTLALAMLGIYGVVAFSVSQRTREVGLRIALGAAPARVVRMVVKEGLSLAMIGLVPGLLVAAAAAHLLRVLIIGFSPIDPVSFTVGAGLLLFAVVSASVAPAFRAARADPMESLRAE